MLVKFTVGNYLSFKERVTIDLTASSLSEYRSENLIPTPLNELHLLKSLVIYGLNSSGKSNLFKAILFTKRFILTSSKDSLANEEIGVEEFKLSTESIGRPSYFEIEITLASTKYRYGFEVDRKKVFREWLYTQSKNKEYELFTRENQNIIIGKKFDSIGEKLVSITRDNALFLSVSAQFNSELAMAILKELDDLSFLSDDMHQMDLTVKMLNDEKFNPLVNNLIKGANLGFKEVKIKKLPFTEDLLLKNNIPKELHRAIMEKNSTPIITTRHTVYNEEKEIFDDIYFDLRKSESMGTKKYISMIGYLLDALLKGKTLIIDEFDSKLHPTLSKAIINLFNSKTNQYGAQFIIASHNSTFINPSNKLFRRDQIVMVGKDRFGISRLETLFQKKIRKDASFEKDYLSGKYEEQPIDLVLSSQLSLFNQ